MQEHIQFQGSPQILQDPFVYLSMVLEQASQAPVDPTVRQMHVNHFFSRNPVGIAPKIQLVIKNIETQKSRCTC
jgi:hypothetical protein